ncbi:MAG: 2-C-methyl-D-erythritol 2,4-cyclodiphosphate synthase [Oxalobacter sp.]
MDNGQVPFRIGQGYDCHVLVEGCDLIIGGVKISHDKGLLGHSDADVLLHAVIDALLGAAGLGDIGSHFSDSDARYQGIDSRKLLRETLALIFESGYAVGNVDATVIAQRPKIAPYISQMKQHIADDLGIDVSQVGVKAKTNERLGFLGREEGIAVQAVALLFRK